MVVTMHESNATIYLRKAQTSDSDEIAAAYSRSKHLHAPFTFPPTNIENYVAQEHRYFVCLKANHAIVGTFNLSNIVRGWFQSAYLGYEVFAPHQQRGYMSQGITLLIDEAFGALNLHRIEANIQPENTASIKLVAKAGFTKEGFSKHYLRIGGTEWKDHERWALVNEHWRPCGSGDA